MAKIISASVEEAADTHDEDSGHTNATPAQQGHREQFEKTLGESAAFKRLRGDAENVGSKVDSLETCVDIANQYILDSLKGLRDDIHADRG